MTQIPSPVHGEGSPLTGEWVLCLSEPLPTVVTDASAAWSRAPEVPDPFRVTRSQARHLREPAPATTAAEVEERKNAMTSGIAGVLPAAALIAVAWWAIAAVV